MIDIDVNAITQIDRWMDRDDIIATHCIYAPVTLCVCV